MNRSVILSATASGAIVLIAALSYLIFSQDLGEFTGDAPPSEVRPDLGTHPKEVMLDIDASADSPAHDDIDASNVNDSIPMTREEAMREYIASMSEEDKQAKPEGYDMETWATFVKDHYNQLKQNGDIEFYGKVVAEDGSPLSGVRIAIRIRTFETSIAKAIERHRPMTDEDFEVITDGHGRFSVIDKFGATLGLSLFEIPGYQIVEGTRLGYRFTPEEAMAALGPPHQADPANPVIFKMIRAELKPGYSLDDFD
jgi:hypothetical protein